MRRQMAEAGVPSPVFRRFPLAADPHEIARQVSYPCVVKPLRLSGSRGVIRANTPDELVAAVTRLGRILIADGNVRETTDILVEDFIPGVEVALDGLLRADGLHVLALFDKPDPLDGPFFEETIYTTPRASRRRRRRPSPNAPRRPPPRLVCAMGLSMRSCASMSVARGW